MMPLADLFVHIYVLVDDALRAGIVPVPRRPGPVPACSDAEVLTIALVRHQRAFLEEVRQDWARPDWRVRRLWGAAAGAFGPGGAGCLSGLRAGGAARLRPTARGSTASGSSFRREKGWSGYRSTWPWGSPRRENATSWESVLRELRERGLERVRRSARLSVYPLARWQRCVVHGVRWSPRDRALFAEELSREPD